VKTEGVVRRVAAITEQEERLVVAAAAGLASDVGLQWHAAALLGELQPLLWHGLRVGRRGLGQGLHLLLAQRALGAAARPTFDAWRAEAVAAGFDL